VSEEEGKRRLKHMLQPVLNGMMVIVKKGVRIMIINIFEN
jgi:hypothetical protein